MKDGLIQQELRAEDVQFSGTVTGNSAIPVTNSDTWYVDGDISASGTGDTWTRAYKTIQEAVTAASAGDVIYVVAKTITDYTTDPANYDENVIIPFATSSLSIIGVSRGRTQGGLPQVKIGGSSTSAMLTVRAPGCLIANMGFNGASSTGGGILLDGDDSTKAAFGTSIINCHFKNCKKHATQATAGGAINWASVGNAWQVLISGCRFYKNVCDICLIGTSNTRPQDVVIENCDFSGYAAYTDCNIYASASGFGSVRVDNCRFGQVPALSSGNVALYFDFQGTLSGTITNCTFGCHTANTGTTITFKDGGTGGSLPTTMHIVKCWGQTGTAGESGEIILTA